MSAQEEGARAELARLRRMVSHLAAYREISRRLQPAVTLPEVARITLATMEEVFGAEGGVLFVLPDPDQPGARPAELATADGLWTALPKPVRSGIIRAALDAQQPLAEPDAAAFLDRESLPPARELVSLLALSVPSGGDPLAVVVAYNLPFTEAVPRYREDTPALLAAVPHAIRHVRLIEARGREARLLGAIQENTRTHLAYLDRDLRFVRANSAYIAGCGHSWEELVGRNHFDLFPNAENEAIFRWVRDTGLPVEFREKPFVFPDQPDRGVTYWDWTLTPIKDDHGVVEGLVLSLTDVTPQVVARERLLAVERARADMAETLAREVNHRMKNNLGMVAGLLQMQVPQGEPEPPGADVVRSAIARILTVAAVHSELYETRSDSLELVAVARQIARIGQDTLARANVEVSVEGSPVECPSGEATALCVCVNELVTNALKHGVPPAGGRLKLEIRVERNGGQVLISVWNSGRLESRTWSNAARGRMGLRLVQEIITRQYRGSFSLTPDRGGVLARITVGEEQLREAG